MKSLFQDATEDRNEMDRLDVSTRAFEKSFV